MDLSARQSQNQTQGEFHRTSFTNVTIWFSFMKFFQWCPVSPLLPDAFCLKFWALIPLPLTFIEVGIASAYPTPFFQSSQVSSFDFFCCDFDLFVWKDEDLISSRFLLFLSSFQLVSVLLFGGAGNGILKRWLLPGSIRPVPLGYRKYFFWLDIFEDLQDLWKARSQKFLFLPWNLRILLELESSRW